MSEDIMDITKEIDDVLETSILDDDAIITDEDVSPMQKLLEENPIKMPQVGEKAKGIVVGIDANALYVDLGVVSGIVYGKEIREGFGANRKKLEIGDMVIAVVQDLESEDGYVELSVREAILEEAWQDLVKKKESREPISTRILDANKGGLMVEINGITGFMPVSQLTSEHYPRVEDGDKNKILEILRTYAGTEMSVCVLDVDQDEEKLIVSEKEANRDKEKTAISELRVGNIVEGEASGVVDFGAFIKFYPPSKKETEQEEDKLEGLVHISQLDWQLIDDPRKVIKVGDKVKAKIISIDDTRISLSVRDLKKDPWVEAAQQYSVNDIVVGKVHKINHFGAFVYLDDDIHGLAHVSGFEEYPQKGIDEIVENEESYMWQIMSMEPAEHRMGLKFVGEIGKVKLSKSIDKKKDAKDSDSDEDGSNDESVDEKKKKTKINEEKNPKRKFTSKKESEEKIAIKEKKVKAEKSDEIEEKLVKKNGKEEKKTENESVKNKKSAKKETKK